jgi:predicted HTH domain antitoxin
MKVITVRIADEDAKALAEIERVDKVDRASAVRKILSEGVRRWKLRHALELLAERKVTMRTAARMAGVTYGEMYDLAAREGVTVGYTLEHLQADLR